MERKEDEALPVATEQTIETSVSMRVEHPRRYRRYTHPHGLRIHIRFYNDSDIDSGDPFLDAIGRLYRDACRGLTPEDN